jgi:arylsulfate sulfotransferase
MTPFHDAGPLRSRGVREPAAAAFAWCFCALIVAAIGGALPADDKQPAAQALAWSLDEPPRWVQSPHVPLAGRIEVATTAPAVVSVQISDGEQAWVAPVQPTPQLAHVVSVLGLKPDREYVLTVTASSATGRLKADPIFVRTPPLPADFPTIKVVTSDAARMEPGVTMCTVLRWEQNAASLDVGWFIALDAAGDVVWYVRMPEPAGAIRRLASGNFGLLHGAQPTGLREIDPLGYVMRQLRATGTGVQPADGELPVAVDTFHHGLYELPNGHWLMPTTEVRRVEQYPVSDKQLSRKQPANLVGDVFAEVRPADGTVLGRWKLLDILDPQRIGYGSLDGFWNLRAYPFVFGGTKDWSHSNSVAHDPTDDSLIVCMRHQDAVVKIDRKTSEVRWILGDPAGWEGKLAARVLKPEGELTWPYHAHAVEFDPDGRVLLFDNGNCRALPPQKAQSWTSSYSRAVEYQVDEEQGTVREVWSYGGPGRDRFFSAFVGSTDWMRRTGNILVCDGGRLESRTGAPIGEPPSAVQWGRVLEVTRDDPADVVFEVHFSEKGLNNGWGSSVYRAERLSSLYPGY